jgi:hypothetical protein
MGGIGMRLDRWRRRMVASLFGRKEEGCCSVGERDKEGGSGCSFVWSHCGT